MWWTIRVKDCNGNTWKHRVLYDNMQFFGTDNLNSLFRSGPQYTAFLANLMTSKVGSLNNLVDRDGCACSLAWEKD